MEIDVILEPDLSPAKVAELAQLAEARGIRAIWHQNYVSQRDPFMTMVAAAQATRRIRIGVVVISPWEMHPVKIANALFTLNEYCGGRASVVIGGGGEWGPVTGLEPERRVRAERETIEIIKGAGPDRWLRYEGQLFKARGYNPRYATDAPPQVYAGASREQMLRMGGRIADGIMMSDVPLPHIADAVGFVREGLAAREVPPPDFHISNVWAWHIKPDRAAAEHEARRELALRGVMTPWYVEPFVSPADAALVAAKRAEFFKAYGRRSSQIEGVPEHVIQALVKGLSMTGTVDEIEAHFDELFAFRDAGVNELAFRVHDDPADAIRLIGERVLPQFR